MSAPRLRQRAGETLRLAAILPFLLVFSAVLLLAPPEIRGATSLSAGRTGSPGGAAPQSASCTALIGGALIDTHADGENSAYTERSLGETVYADLNGNRWILVNVGNEVVSFSINGSGYVYRRGKTDTGLSGSGHDPYQLAPDPVVASDGFRYIYLMQQGGIWYIDGMSLGYSNIHAVDITARFAFPVQWMALVPMGSKMTAVLQITGSPGQSPHAERWRISDPSDPTIHPTDPATWVFETNFLPGLAGSYAMQLESSGTLKSGFNRYVVVDYKQGSLSIPAIIDATSDSPEINVFPPSPASSNGSYGLVRFGLIGNDVYGAALANGRPHLFQIVPGNGTGVAITLMGSPIPVPTENNPSGLPVNFTNCQVVSDQGILDCMDFAGPAQWFFDVSQPATIGDSTLPIAGPTVDLYNHFLPPYANPWKAVPIGFGEVAVAATGYFYVFGLSCSGLGGTCSFGVEGQNNGTGKNYPGEPLIFSEQFGSAPWSWNFGDGTSPLSTASVSVAHAFATTGTYTVNFRAAGDPTGCDQSVTVDLPTPAATASPSTSVAGEAITLAATANALPQAPYPTFLWTIFDGASDVTNAPVVTWLDGTTPTSASPTVSFSAPPANDSQSRYTVRCDVGYTASTSVPAFTSVPVTANLAGLSYSPSFPTVNTGITLSSSAKGAVASWEWRLTHAWNGKVWLSAANGNLPIPDFGVSPETLFTACASPTDLCYTAELTVGDGPLDSQHRPTGTTDTKSISFSVDPGCASASFLVSLGNGGQLCGSEPSGDTTCTEATTCDAGLKVGDSVTFRPDCQQAGNSFRMDYGDGSPVDTVDSTGAPIAFHHIYASAATFPAVLTLNGGLDSDQECIVVHEATSCVPTASFSWSAIGKKAAFTNLSTNYDESSWSFGDGQSSTATNPSHTYAWGGTYTVSLKVTKSTCTTGANYVSTQRTITIDGTDCPAPGEPTPIAPSDGATKVDATGGIAHVWASGGSTATFDLAWYEGAGCTGTLLNSYLDLPSTIYTIPAAAYSPGATYSWRVTPINSDCVNPSGTPSACFSYTTKVTGSGACTEAVPPALLAPADGATGVLPTDVTFSWTNVATPGCDTIYELSLRSGACDGTRLIDFSGLASNSYTVAALPEKTTIFWQVTASNELGSSPASPCSSFETTSNAGVPKASYVVRRNGAAIGDSTLALGATYTFDGGGSSAASGETLTKWSWDFGDGTSGTGPGANHVFASAGSYTVTLTVTQSGGLEASQSRSWTILAGGGDGEPIALLVPGVAHADGQNGTTWITDLRILNPDPAPLTIRLEFRASGGDNSNAPAVELDAIPSMATRTISDVLRELFGVSGGAGALVVTWSGVTKRPVLHANTYNLASGGDPAAGTYGQLIPPLPIVPSRTSSNPILLEGLRISADPTDGFRTNLGLANLAGAGAEVAVEIRGASGETLAANSFWLPPYGVSQFPVDRSRFPELALPLDAGSLRVLPAAGASVRAYLSVVDNSSGDGTFVSDEHVTGRSVFLPGAAAASGSAGTSWGTSLFVANPSPSPMSLEVGYTPNGADGPARRVTRSLELPAGGAVVRHDVVRSLFLLDGTAGILDLSLADGAGVDLPLVSTRTYNDASGGTYGQSIPARDPLATIGHDDPSGLLLLPGLSKTAAFRSNAGLYNQSSGESGSILMMLLDAEGQLLRTADGSTVVASQLRLEPGAGIQLNELFGALGADAASYPGATLVVVSTDGAGEIAAWASVVDNVTGDPIFIPGEKR